MSETTNEELRREIARLEREVDELDARNLELEKEVARRGVKLSCANIALARAKIAFDGMSKEREEALQDIAHDLRTPLTSIKGACQNVLDGIAGPIDEPVREYVEIVHEQATRLVDVVNGLVGAIRAATEPMQMDCERLDVGALVEEVVHLLRPLADEKRIDLEVEAFPWVAEVDPTKLSHALENLVGNALKFTDDGGSVKVTMRDGPDHVSIEVRDDGIGMSEADIDRLFHRYYRAPSDREGSGLGLLIARQIARLHGGTIEVESVVGEGSSFTLFLPKRASVAPPAP